MTTDGGNTTRHLLVSIANPWFDDEPAALDAADCFMTDLFGRRGAPGPCLIETDMTADEYHRHVVDTAQNAGVEPHVLILDVTVASGEVPKLVAVPFEPGGAVTLRSELLGPGTWRDVTGPGRLESEEPF